jgi:tetraacyldisaccharide 4'-kinase
MKKIIEKWMRSESGGTAHTALYALSLLYDAGVRLRLLFYSIGVFKGTRLPCRVISIGNITAGGSGKTPMAMHVAGLLKEGGARVVILSRGYKRSTTGTKVVSDGKELKLTPKEAGDEPFLMARRLKDIPIVVGEDRVSAGEFAVKEFSPDCIVLDDGFQHLGITRDLNILLVDARTGFGKGHLLPSGVLREPIRGITRADLAMAKVGEEGGLRVRDSDRLKRFNLQVITFGYRAGTVIDLKTMEGAGVETLRGKKAAAVAGLAQPDAFFASLKPLGLNIVKELPYPDHHDYTRADLEVIKKAATGADLIVTTEKDGVKIERFAKDISQPLVALSIDVVVDEERRLMKYLLPFMKEKHKDALTT